MLKVDVITYQAMASQQSMLVLTRGDYVWLSYSRLRIILKMVKISIIFFSIIYRECFQTISFGLISCLTFNGTFKMELYNANNRPST